MSHEQENPTFSTPCSIQQALLAGLREEMDAALLNILHFSWDIWTCKTSGKIFFVGRSIIPRRQGHLRTRPRSACGKSLDITGG